MAATSANAHYDFPVGAAAAKVEIKVNLTEAPATPPDEKLSIAAYPYRDAASAARSSVDSFSGDDADCYNMKLTKMVAPLMGATIACDMKKMSPVTYFMMESWADNACDNITSIDVTVFDVTGVTGTAFRTNISASMWGKGAGTVFAFVIYLKSPPTNRDGAGMQFTLQVMGKPNGNTMIRDAVKAVAQTAQADYPSAFPALPDSMKSLDGVDANAVAETDRHKIHSDSLTVGVSWDRSSGLDIDLMAVISAPFADVMDVVYYNKRQDDNGIVRHSGDSRVGQSDFRYGAGNGDDEQITVDLKKLREGQANTGRAMLRAPRMITFVITAHNGFITNDAHVTCYSIEGANGVGRERMRYEFKDLTKTNIKSIQLWSVALKTPDWAPFGVNDYDYFDESFQGYLSDASLTESIFFMSRRSVGAKPNSKADKEWDARTEWVDIRLMCCEFPYRGYCPGGDNGPIERPAPGARPAGLSAPPAIPAHTPVSAAGKGEVHIAVHCATNLHAGDNDGFSDPYVVISRANGKGKKVKTRVAAKTLFPSWEEVLTLAGPFEEKDVLKFQVYDKDLLSDDFLGEVLVPMSDIGLLKGVQMLKLTGVVFADKKDDEDKMARGHLFVSMDWTDAFGPGKVNPK